MSEETKIVNRKPQKEIAGAEDLPAYDAAFGEISGLIEQARHSAARSVNALMTATYWLIGRRIVEFEQGGEARAEYGVGLLKQLSKDLEARFGRGFSERNLEQMRLFFLEWPISQTVSAKSDAPQIRQTMSAESRLSAKCSTASSKSSEEPLSEGKVQTVSGLFRPTQISPTLSAKFSLEQLARCSARSPTPMPDRCICI
jgi:hypothetical protein